MIDGDRDEDNGRTNISPDEQTLRQMVEDEETHNRLVNWHTYIRWDYWPFYTGALDGREHGGRSSSRAAAVKDGASSAPGKAEEVLQRLRGLTVDKAAEELLTIMKDDKGLKVLTRHERKCVALDLVCESFPSGYAPSQELIEVLRTALDLPEDHEVGLWAKGRKGKHGHFADGRGSNKKQALEVWQESIDIDTSYFHSHERKRMPLRELERELDVKFGKRAPSRSVLREWREDGDYVKEAFSNETRFCILKLLKTGPGWAADVGPPGGGR
jgi:hypothetical protein